MSDSTLASASESGESRDPADPANEVRDPGYWPAMFVLGLLFVLAVVATWRALAATFGA